MKSDKRRRTTRLATVLIGLIGGSIFLGACGSGSDAATLGHEACVDVAKSISVYDSSATAPTPAAAATDKSKALAKLRAALQPAAIAGSEDGSWQALMATLSESSRVKESLLIPALQAQCSGN